MGLKSFGKRLASKASDAISDIGKSASKFGTRVGKKAQSMAKNIGQSAQLGLTQATGGLIKTPYAKREAEDYAKEAEARKRMARYGRSRMAGGGTVNFDDEREETY